MENIVKQDKYYTYKDFVALNDGNQYELHNGKLFMMSGPLQKHSDISGEVFRQIANYLIDKPCNVNHAPFDVRLFEDTVYQPDVLVVCDQSKLDGKCCNGAPDFILEVLSDSTRVNDIVTKFNDYLKAGVREYWIIDPVSNILTAFRLIDKIYSANVYSENDIAPIQVLDGLEIDLVLVFKLQ